MPARRRAGYRPIIAVVNERGAAQRCENWGRVRAELMGQLVEQSLLQGGLGITSAVGFGRGEILEFGVLPSSPAIGVPLSELRADGWRVAAIYRGSQLVLPTGTTAIAADDRVLVVGDPSQLPHVAESLRVGLPTFPLLHGPNVVVYLPSGRDGAVETEAELLTTRTRAARLVRFYRGASGARKVVDTPRPDGATCRKFFEEAALEDGTIESHVAVLRSKRPGVVVTRPEPRRAIDVLLGRGGRDSVLCNLELLVVSASSVGMPLAVLQESGQLQRPLGRYVLLTASIGEFVSILGITAYELFAEEASLPHRVFKLMKVLLLFGVSALLIQWARAVVWWKPEPFRRLIQHHDVAELGVRSGLLVMFAFVLIAAGLGVEPILGAFIAGALMAFVLREKTMLESKIAALGHGLFIPIFFIVVGVRFDPRLLDIAAVRDAFALLVVVAAVKIIPSLLFAPRPIGFRERTAAACLLAAPLTLVVAIATIGVRLGAIHEREQASFVLLAIALSVGFPTLFRVVAPAAPENEPITETTQETSRA